jgi:hypothetical protein
MQTKGSTFLDSEIAEPSHSRTPIPRKKITFKSKPPLSEEKEMPNTATAVTK